MTTVDRRSLLRGLGGLSVAAAAPAVARTVASGATTQLPDRPNFTVEGVHLNAAYTHPLGNFAIAAGEAYMRTRAIDGARNWPNENARDGAVARYAFLIGARPENVAIVPSTLEGENLIGNALGLGPGAGVVTDAFHYDAALAWYGERAKRGMPLAVVAPRGNDFHYDDFARAITPQTRLVAVSLVSSQTGYQHDLRRLCDIAHAKGALVYADMIQAVGAVPFDVDESGVDFCCAGTYKWLMGEFGTAFLYVKPSVLPRLRRVQFGWAGLARYQSHVLPGDPPGPPIGDWETLDTTAGVFEVSTLNWSGLATAQASLDYIASIGVDAIARHRAPLLRRLRERLLPVGYVPLATAERQGPALVLARSGVRARYGDALRAARIHITLYQDRIRVSPSVHNDMDDIDRLIAVLTA